MNKQTKIDGILRHLKIGNCQICNRKEKLCIDHNHQSGYVRGVLCNSCNSGLGFFKDNAELLCHAIGYLKVSPYLEYGLVMKDIEKEREYRMGKSGKKQKIVGRKVAKLPKIKWQKRFGY